jgi:hypothetical protein
MSILTCSLVTANSQSDLHKKPGLGLEHVTSESYLFPSLIKFDLVSIAEVIGPF